MGLSAWVLPQVMHVPVAVDLHRLLLGYLCNIAAVLVGGYAARLAAERWEGRATKPAGCARRPPRHDGQKAGLGIAKSGCATAP